MSCYKKVWVSEVSHYDLWEYIVLHAVVHVCTFFDTDDTDTETKRITEGGVVTERVCLYISILFCIILIIPNN